MKRFSMLPSTLALLLVSATATLPAQGPTAPARASSAPVQAAPAPPEKKHAEPEPQAGPRIPEAFGKDRGEVKSLPRHDDDVVVVREMRDVKEIIFNPDAVPVVNCQPHIVTSIFLPEGEQIASATIGDDSHWLVSPIQGKNVIFIKPVQVGKHYETNLVVITAKGNVYNIGFTADPDQRAIKTLRILPPAGAVSDDDNGDGVFRVGGPMGVGGANGRRMSQADLDAMADQIRQQERDAEVARQRKFVEAMLLNRNDDYKITYSWHCPFRITNIFDASGVTWIRVETPDGAQPMIYAIDEGGHRSVVNYQPSSVDPHVLMVDRKLSKAILIVGKKEAHIENIGLKKQISALPKAS
jgi:type IV secretory pathway VirB9-like protein